MEGGVNDLDQAFGRVDGRCGWTTMKDRNQTRVLALHLSREGFERLLQQAQLSHRSAADGVACRDAPVVVQWDPEMVMDPHEAGRQALTRPTPNVRSVMARQQASEEAACGRVRHRHTDTDTRRHTHTTLRVLLVVSRSFALCTPVQVYPDRASRCGGRNADGPGVCAAHRGRDCALSRGGRSAASRRRRGRGGRALARRERDANARAARARGGVADA